MDTLKDDWITLYLSRNHIMVKLLSIYADYIILIGKMESEINKLEGILTKEYEIKHLGLLKYKIAR